MSRSTNAGLTRQGALVGAAAAIRKSSAAKVPGEPKRVPVIDIANL